MSTNAIQNFFSRKKAKTKKEKPKIDADEKIFLISLYPKGRTEKSLFDQLKEKFPTASEGVLKDRMRKWLVRLNSYGMVYIIPTEEIGNVVSLTKNGVNYIRNKIKKLLKNDTELFVEIINRLMKEQDEWTLEYYNSQSKRMVRGYLPLYAVIFDPKPLGVVVRDLKDPFGLKLDDLDRQKKFEDDIKLMEAFGLIDIVYDDSETILVASSTTKKIYAELLRNGLVNRNEPKEKQKREKSVHKKLEKNILLHDKFVIVSVIIALLVAFGMLVNFFPIDPITNILTIENHYGIYIFLTIPPLVLLFYIVISKGYYVLAGKIKTRG